jgi:hypothetical protein
MSVRSTAGSMQEINKMKKSTFALAALLVAVSGGALAAMPSASMTVTQSDGTSWVENLTGLVAVDAQNNFAMVQGDGTTGFYQNGQFVSATSTGAHPDYWQWMAGTGAGAGYWNWHSSQTLTGSTPATTDASNPWMSAIRLQNVAGHGDPDLIYAVSAVNNSNLTQTYTMTVGEAIVPTVSGANITYADISGGLTSRSGSGSGTTTTTIEPINPSGIQQFQLSADGGATFVNAGVDVGPTASTVGTSGYGVYAATNANGPVGQTWNYIQLVSTFALSAKSAASLTGFASITPVPEPIEGAMLLLGLALLVPLIRHRNRKAE